MISNSSFLGMRRRARAKRTLDLAVRIRRGEHDDARIRELAADRNERIGTARTRQTDIHERDIRPMFPELGDGFDGRLCVGNDPHVRLRIDDHGQTLPKNGMIFDAQNTNHRFFTRHLCRC